MNKFWNINFNFAKKIKEDSINNEILSIKVLRIVSSLSTIESLKNMWFYMQTKELPCEMEERNVSQHRIFSMDTKCINEPKKKRTTRRKK